MAHTTALSCAACGAPLPEASGRCAYCGSGVIAAWRAPSDAPDRDKQTIRSGNRATHRRHAPAKGRWCVAGAMLALAFVATFHAALVPGFIGDVLAHAGALMAVAGLWGWVGASEPGTERPWLALLAGGLVNTLIRLAEAFNAARGLPPASMAEPVAFLALAAGLVGATMWWGSGRGWARQRRLIASTISDCGSADR